MNYPVLKDFPDYRNHVKVIDRLCSIDPIAASTENDDTFIGKNGSYHFADIHLSHQAFVCETITEIYYNRSLLLPYERALNTAQDVSWSMKKTSLRFLAACLAIAVFSSYFSLLCNICLETDI